MRLHYAGTLRFTKTNGSTVNVLPGWAACVSGDRARKIRKEGRHTYRIEQVTCKTCLKLIAMSLDSAATPKG